MTSITNELEGLADTVGNGRKRHNGETLSDNPSRPSSLMGLTTIDQRRKTPPLTLNRRTMDYVADVFVNPSSLWKEKGQEQVVIAYLCQLANEKHDNTLKEHADALDKAVKGMESIAAHRPSVRENTSRPVDNRDAQYVVHEPSELRALYMPELIDRIQKDVEPHNPPSDVREALAILTGKFNPEFRSLLARCRQSGSFINGNGNGFDR